MRLPNGIGERILAHTIEKFEVKLKHTDYGPVLIGTMEELEEAKDAIYKHAGKVLDISIYEIGDSIFHSIVKIIKTNQ